MSEIELLHELLVTSFLQWPKPRQVLAEVIPLKNEFLLASATRIHLIAVVIPETQVPYYWTASTALSQPADAEASRKSWTPHEYHAEASPTGLPMYFSACFWRSTAFPSDFLLIRATAWEWSCASSTVGIFILCSMCAIAWLLSSTKCRNCTWLAKATGKVVSRKRWKKSSAICFFVNAYV